jgi:hypothetical protein
MFMANTLGEFIKKYKKDHDLNNYTLADLLNEKDPNPDSNWSHVTVSKYSWYGLKEMYSNKPISYPEIPFLIALARATNTSILHFMRLIAPDVVYDPDPDLEDIINRFKALPKEKRDGLRSVLGWEDFKDSKSLGKKK